MPEEAHRNLRISPAEFDEVAAGLGRTLDFVKLPKRKRGEVLAAFKGEVTTGYPQPVSTAEAFCSRPTRSTQPSWVDCLWQLLVFGFRNY
jgi:hypothetical protein